jgi:cellobiose-specific phosphotransferase system component IIB
MSLFNFAGGATVVHLSAAASNASTVTGAAVDLNGYDAPVAIIQSHGTSTGTLDGKIQDSADGSTGWADVSGAAFTQSTTTADVKVLALNPTAVKRYIRYVGTVVTGPQVVGVVLVGVKKSV